MTLDIALPDLRRWLPAQRWYSARDHQMLRAEVQGGAAVGVDGPWLVRVTSTHREPDARIDWLLCLAPVAPTHPAVIGTVDGRPVADIADAPEAAAVITTLIDSAGQPYSTRDLPLRVLSGRRRSATPQGTAHVIQGEQSNTAVVVGGARVVKIMRRMHPGPHPEVELTGALTDAGVHGIPALHGAILGPADTLLVLQSAFIPDTSDGWKLALDEARGSADHGLLLMHETGGLHRLGRLIRDVHEGLTPLGVQSVDDRRHALRVLGRRLRGDAGLTVAALQRAIDLGRRTGGPSAALDPQAISDTIDVRVEAAMSGLVTDDRRPPALQRVHGDLHLGQVLRDPERTWWVTDFEGEPGRPMAHRRAPAPPAVDLAGMVRSIDYVAGTAIREGAPAVDALGWAAEATHVFLDGYGMADDDPWVRAMALDKLLYELRHEAANRPGWLSLPLAALDSWLPARTQGDLAVPAAETTTPAAPGEASRGDGRQPDRADGDAGRMLLIAVPLEVWPTHPDAGARVAVRLAAMGITHVELALDGPAVRPVLDQLHHAGIRIVLRSRPVHATGADVLAALLAHPGVAGLRADAPVGDVRDITEAVDGLSALLDDGGSRARRDV